MRPRPRGALHSELAKKEILAGGGRARRERGVAVVSVRAVRNSS